MRFSARTVVTILALLSLTQGYKSSGGMIVISAETTNSAEDWLVRLHSISEGVAAVCDSMEDKVVAIGDASVHLPLIGGVIRGGRELLGIPDKVDKLRSLMVEQNKAIMSAVGAIRSDVDAIKSDVDKLSKNLDLVLEQVYDGPEEALRVKLVAFQKNITDRPPTNPGALQMYQDRFREHVTDAYALAATRYRGIQFAVAANTMATLLVQLHDLDIAMSVNRADGIDAGYYQSGINDVRLTFRMNGVDSKALDINDAQQEYSRRSNDLVMHARKYGIHPIVDRNGAGRVRFAIAGEEKYVRRYEPVFTIFPPNYRSVPEYDNRAFVRAFVINRAAVDDISGICVYKTIHDPDLTISSRVDTHDPDQPPVKLVGRIDQTADEYVKSCLDKFNGMVSEAKDATSRYVVLTSLSKWEKASKKTLDELEKSLPQARVSGKRL